MNKPPLLTSSFAHLQEHDEQLLRLGMLAERYFPDDPNTALLKLRQLTELLAQLVATKVGLYQSPEEPQYDLLRRLQDHGILPREIAQLFGEVRRAGNAASHTLMGDHRTALAALKITWQLGLWFHRTFRNPAFKSGPFIPPQAPQDESAELRAELTSLRQALAQDRAVHQETAQRLDAAETRLREARDEQSFWEQMASEAEAAKAALQQRLAAQQAETAAQPREAVTAFVAAANTAAAAVHLDEAETRKLIDQQLRQAGWIADSATLVYAQGARPEKNKNLTIAEWPTHSGPADYVLFVGLVPIAVVEAKRQNVDVSAALQQARRYSRGFTPSPETMLHAENWGPDGAYRIPFAFSSNGRPFLRQLATRSGIWFCDLRRPDNLGHALDGWYTPEGLTALLKHDAGRAHAQLKREPFAYGFALRHYQQAAIQAAEAAIARGQRDMLLAMATGTGKTKTCIALIYRLLKAQRFRRVLFLVDRSALGEQAANAFKDTRMESLQTFADIFGIKELDEQRPDTDTAVHIATVQGMVQRVLYPNEDEGSPPVDQYDCIVVDECHRGYLLDRELSDTELSFRNYDDYISKYRRVLDYFDAVKIGLTATPALHTTQIFGAPIFTYSYREAVIDGYLVDHEPPVQINTALSTSGIVWKVGEAVEVYHVHRSQLDLFTTPDEIKLEVEDFNRKVITESFNRVVCEFLAQELDPSSRQKTLIFCVNDAHADLVVHLLKQAFEQHYGSLDDDAVIKITGAADKPLQLIRRYKNERHPNVAVTVDLLTTGVDVPEICNLVFLRRVNSRILFDQMLGRATRLCDEIGKETFRIFDAVKIYEALQGLTAMQPVVVNPAITFTQLARELVQVTSDAERALVRDQFIVKLQRRKRHLSAAAARDFETCAGMPPDAFIERLKSMPLTDVVAWFTHTPDLGEILDRQGEGHPEPVFVSHHDDRLLGTERGYGQAQRPEDYLQEFSDFIRSRSNAIPAGHRWGDLEARPAPDRLEAYKLTLIHLGSHGSRLVQEIFANASSFIKKPATLSTLVAEIDKLDWYSARQEGLGDLYEGLLEKNANEKKSGAGQYFTPRPLIDSMVAVMQPTLDDIIQDPAAGTGGFLIAANRYLREHSDPDTWTEAQQRKYHRNTFYGMEHVQDAHRLALMNLMLHGLDSDPDAAGIRYGDTLSPEGEALPKATLILTNPPFGTKKGGGLPTRTDFTFPTSNKQFCFLQHIYRGLKPGGRAAVVQPDNVLFEGNTGRQIRVDLLDKCDLHTILRLPTGIFYAQGVKTNVLFFTRGETDKGNTREVWVYDLRVNMPQFGKRTMLTRAHFAEFEAAFGDDPLGSAKSLAQRQDTGESGRFRRFPRDWIAERGDSLDIAWLKDESEGVTDELPEPAALAQEAMGELEAAMEELRGILEELGEEVEA